MYPCDPGETVSLGMQVSGNDLPGVAEPGNQDYTDMGSLSGNNGMLLVISGQATLPAPGKGHDQDVHGTV